LTSLDISNTQLVPEVKQTSYIKKAEVSGASFEVGALVTYQGQECKVTKRVDSDGELRVTPVADISGAVAIADAISNTRAMTSLNLASNSLGVEGAEIVAAFLPKCT
jgi:hypothetical protein